MRHLRHTLTALAVTSTVLSAQTIDDNDMLILLEELDVTINNNGDYTSPTNEAFIEGSILSDLFYTDSSAFDINNNGLDLGEIANMISFGNDVATAYGDRTLSSYIGDAFQSVYGLNQSNVIVFDEALFNPNDPDAALVSKDYSLTNTTSTKVVEAFKDYDTIFGNLYDADDADSGGAADPNFIFTNDDGGAWETNLVNFNAGADGNVNNHTLADVLFSFDDALSTALLDESVSGPLFNAGSAIGSQNNTVVQVVNDMDSLLGAFYENTHQNTDGSVVNISNSNTVFQWDAATDTPTGANLDNFNVSADGNASSYTIADVVLSLDDAIGNLEGDHDNNNVNPNTQFSTAFYQTLGTLGGEYGNGFHTGFQNFNDTSSIAAMFDDLDKTIGSLDSYMIDIDDHFNSGNSFYASQLGASDQYLNISPITGNSTGFSSSNKDGFVNALNLSNNSGSNTVTMLEVDLGQELAIGAWNTINLNNPNLVAGNLMPLSNNAFDAATMNFSITDNLSLINEAFGPIQILNYDNIQNMTNGNNNPTSLALMFSDIDGVIGDWSGTIDDGSGGNALQYVDNNDSIAEAVAALDNAIVNASGGGGVGTVTVTHQGAGISAPAINSGLWNDTVAANFLFNNISDDDPDNFYNIDSNDTNPTLNEAVSELDEAIGALTAYVTNWNSVPGSSNDLNDITDQTTPFMNAPWVTNSSNADLTNIVIGLDYHMGNVPGALNNGFANAPSAANLTDAVVGVDTAVGDFASLFEAGGAFENATINNVDGQAGVSIADMLVHLDANAGSGTGGTGNIVIPAGTYNIINAGNNVEDAAIALDQAFGNISVNYNNFDGGNTLEEVFNNINTEFDDVYTALNNSTGGTATMPTNGNFFFQNDTVTTAVTALDAELAANSMIIGSWNGAGGVGADGLAGIGYATNGGGNINDALLALDTALANISAGGGVGQAALDAAVGDQNYVGVANQFTNNNVTVTATNTTEAINNVSNAIGDVSQLNAGGNYFAAPLADDMDVISALTQMDSNINSAVTALANDVSRFDSAIASQNQKISNNTARIDALDSKVSKAIAMTSALDFTAAPCCKSSRIFFGGSSYDGEVGYGIGYSYNMNDTFDISVGYASGGGTPLDDDAETMFKGQVGYSW